MLLLTSISILPAAVPPIVISKNTLGLLIVVTQNVTNKNKLHKMQATGSKPLP